MTQTAAGRHVCWQVPAQLSIIAQDSSAELQVPALLQRQRGTSQLCTSTAQGYHRQLGCGVGALPALEADRQLVSYVQAQNGDSQLISSLQKHDGATTDSLAGVWVPCLQHRQTGGGPF